MLLAYHLLKPPENGMAVCMAFSYERNTLKAQSRSSSHAMAGTIRLTTEQACKQARLANMDTAWEKADVTDTLLIPSP